MVTFSLYTFAGAHATQGLCGAGTGGMKHIRNQAQCCLLAINMLRAGTGGVGWETSEKEMPSTPSEVALHSHPISSSWSAHQPQARCAHKGPGQEQRARGHSAHLPEGRKVYGLRVDAALQLIPLYLKALPAGV